MTAGRGSPTRFPFAPRGGGVPWWSGAFGVRRDTSWVEIGDGELRARFGPWTVATPLANISGVEVTGPYSWWKVAGPARYSPTDRSLTFATSTGPGVEISFVRPVTGLDPWGFAHHPSLTVTVADPEALAEALARS